MEDLAESPISTASAKLIIYEAFIEGGLEAPKQLARSVHDSLFHPALRGIPASDAVESVQRVYRRLQGARPDPAVQGNRETGGISRSGLRGSSEAKRSGGRPAEPAAIAENVMH